MGKDSWVQAPAGRVRVPTRDARPTPRVLTRTRAAGTLHWPPSSEGCGCTRRPRPREGENVPDDVSHNPGFPVPLMIVGGLIFLIVVAVFVTVIVKGLAQWGRKNDSPVVTTSAVVTSKRTDVSGGSNERRAITSYFVTFETSTGERHELRMPGNNYGVLSEGDEGRLAFQGARYRGFERSRLGIR